MDIKKVFGKKYSDSSSPFGDKPMSIIVEAIKHIDIKKDALLLGVGDGRNAAYLLSKDFNVVGVDLSEEGLKILEDKHFEEIDNNKLKLILGSVTDIEISDKFSLVGAIGLLHFLEDNQVDTVIKKMKSRTRETGITVTVVRRTQNIMGNLPHIFKKNELHKYYDSNEWDILLYKEKQIGPKEVALLISKRIK